MKTARPYRLNYSATHSRSGNGGNAHGVVLRVISLVLCFGGPVIALLLIDDDRGNPFPFVKVGAAGVWLMANAVGLVLSAGGCAVTWRSQPNAGYVLCILSHTGNWLSVAAFFFGMRYF